MNQPDIHSQRQRLLALLVAEAKQVETFAALLEEERQALTLPDAEPLFAIAERKTALAKQLKQFADARQALLSQVRLKDDRQGYETLLGTPLPDIWSRFIATAERAHRLNQENGVLITNRLAHNHQALAILMAHSDQPTTYGRDGTSRTRPNMRHLGSV